MGGQEIRSAIKSWCASGPLVLADEDEDQDGFTLRISSLGRYPIEVDVVIPATYGAELTVGHLWATESAIAAWAGTPRDERLAIFGTIIDDVTMARPGRLTCLFQHDDTASQVAILCPVHEDGFNRQTFLAAVADVGKTRRQIERFLATLIGLASAEQGASQTEGASRTDRAAPHNVAPRWAPTHVVPAGGLMASRSPDSSEPPTVQLPMSLPVRVIERSGPWAKIDTENLWTGWVDGNALR